MRPTRQRRSKIETTSQVQQAPQDNFSVELSTETQQPTQTAMVDQSDPSVTYFEKDPTTGQIRMVGQQQQSAPEVAQPVQPVVHQQEVQPQQPQVIDRPGYIPIQDDYGNIVTWIPNDPTVISRQTFGDKKYISDLHRILDENGIARPGHTAPKTPKTAPPPAISKDQLIEQARAIAAKNFPQQDGEGRPLDVTPIANTIAELLAETVGKTASEVAELRQQAEQSRIVAQYASELAEIQAIDPRFRLDDPGVIQMSRMHPDWSPQQVHRELIYLESMNGKQAPPQQQQPPPPTQTVPPTMFSTPGNGSAQTPHMAQDSSPDVVAAVKAYEDAMRYYGKPATEEGKRMVRAQAIAQRNANPEKSIILRTN